MAADPVRSTDISICNAAFAGLGINPITDFTDSSEQAKLAKATYAMHLEQLMTAHPWNFAMKHATLDMAIKPTQSWRWDYAFSLPSDQLRVWEVQDQSANVEDEWTVSDSLLLTNLYEQKEVKVTSVNTSTETLTSAAHGFSNNDVVVINNISGLTDDTVLYYIISSATDTFQLSTSSGGSAANLTGAISGTATVTRRTLDIRYVQKETDPTKWSPQFATALVAKLEAEWAEPLVKATTLGDRKDFRFNQKLAQSRSLDAQEGTPERQDVSTWLNER